MNGINGWGEDGLKREQRFVWGLKQNFWKILLSKSEKEAVRVEDKRQKTGVEDVSRKKNVIEDEEEEKCEGEIRGGITFCYKIINQIKGVVNKVNA